MYKDNKKRDGGRFSRASNYGRDERTDIRSIMKEIELLGSAHMTWKERKALENKKAVSLGGKPQKQHRFPLNVAILRMKKQKQKEEKMEQERMVLGCFGGKTGEGYKKSESKRKPEDRVLKSTEGNFRNGALNVKHLLNQAPSREVNIVPDMFSNGQKKGSEKGKGKGKGKGKKNKGKKSGGKRRH